MSLSTSGLKRYRSGELTDRYTIGYTLVTMNYAVVVTKVDPQTKREAQETAEKLGMPLSVVIKAFLKQFIKTKTVRFSLRDEYPSEYLIKAIKQARQDLKAGKASPTFKTTEEAISFLDKQRL